MGQHDCRRSTMPDQVIPIAEKVVVLPDVVWVKVQLAEASAAIAAAVIV